MGEPLIRFPVVCPDCQSEHLASIPFDVIAAALAKTCRISIPATRRNSFSWDATQAEIRELQKYLSAIIKCPAHQPRFSPALEMTRNRSTDSSQSAVTR
jgi:hypothetical protein